MSGPRKHQVGKCLGQARARRVGIGASSGAVAGGLCAFMGENTRRPPIGPAVAPTRSRLLLGALGLESLGVGRTWRRCLRAFILLGLFLLAIAFLFFAHFQSPQPGLLDYSMD